MIRIGVPFKGFLLKGSIRIAKRGIGYNIGALMIRIGFGGILYFFF